MNVLLQVLNSAIVAQGASPKPGADDGKFKNLFFQFGVDNRTMKYL